MYYIKLNIYRHQAKVKIRAKLEKHLYANGKLRKSKSTSIWHGGKKVRIDEIFFKWERFKKT
jgi:hypothetical protein